MGSWHARLMWREGHRRRCGSPARARAAFTLIEVLLVIVLLAALVGLAWPSLASATKRGQIDESARRMKSLVSMLRASSMNEARRHRLTIRQDGSVAIRRQFDAIRAPHIFTPVRELWAQTPPLLEEVWVDEIVPLPDGPPPIVVEDALVEFTDDLADPLSLSEVGREVDVNFEPDGVSNSLRWVLRDSAGRGIQMTLDGRLGRITMESLAAVEGIQRPRPLSADQLQEEAARLSELEEQYEERVP